MPYTEISDRETVSVLEYLHNDFNTTVSTHERMVLEINYNFMYCCYNIDNVKKTK